MGFSGFSHSFKALFNAKSIGYHTDTISRIKLLDCGTAFEELRHFTITPDSPHTFAITEISDGGEKCRLTGELDLSQAIAKAEQLFALRLETLKTTANCPTQINIVEGLSPSDEDFDWLHTNNALEEKRA